jgi:hypothetical protein
MARIIKLCMVHHLAETPEGAWSRQLYNAVLTVRRSGNYELEIEEDCCAWCLDIAKRSLLALFAERQAAWKQSVRSAMVLSPTPQPLSP